MPCPFRVDDSVTQQLWSAVQGFATSENIRTLATVLALLWAVFIYSSTVRDARRAQAALVSAWIGPDPGDTEHRLLHIKNGSDQPVYTVSVRSTLMLVDDYPLEVLPPQTDETVAAAPQAAGNHGGEYGANLELVFTDAANRRWRRRAGSQGLHRLRWWHKQAKQPAESAEPS